MLMTRRLIALALTVAAAGCVGDSSQEHSSEDDAIVLWLLLGGGAHGGWFGGARPRPTGSGTFEVVADRPLDALAGAQVVVSAEGLPDQVVADVDVAAGSPRAILYPVRGVDLRPYRDGAVRLR
jgi:hypothetical protein